MVSDTICYTKMSHPVSTLMYRTDTLFDMKRVDIAGLAVDSASGVPLVVLREVDAPHRMLPIAIGGLEAAAIAFAVSGQAPPRPLTHDLMAMLVERLDGHVDAVEVTTIADGTFHASLAMHGPTGSQQLDTRPSDAIALALRFGAPLFVADAVLDTAGIVEQAAPSGVADLDADQIDAMVDEFRSFLDTIDADEFARDTGDGPDATDDDPEAHDGG